MRIKHKLIILPVVVFFLLSSMAAIAWLGLEKINKLNKRTHQYEQQSMYLQMILRGTNESILTNGTEDSIILAQSGIEKFTHLDTLFQNDTSLNDLEVSFTDYAKHNIHPLWDTFVSEIQPFLVLNSVPQNDEALIMYGRLLRISDQIHLHLNEMVRMSSASASSETKRIWSIIALTAAIIIMCIMFLFRHLYIHISIPINRLRNIMNVVTSNKTEAEFEIRNNIRAILDKNILEDKKGLKESGDEIGDLSMAFKDMLKNIDEHVAKKDRMRNELNELNTHLEQRVHDRTIELEVTNTELESQILIHEQTEKELAMARDEAMAASRMKTQFLANMSHEIRTPMNGVIGMLSLLDTTDLTEEQKQYLHMAHAAGDKLLVLINDILDLSKIDAGKLVLESTKVGIAELLNENVELLQTQANEKGLQLSCSIDENIPDYVLTDPVRVTQIINNVVNNAIKFTGAGSVQVSLHLTDLFDDVVNLEFEVEDTGIGMSAECQSRIFEVFTQADGSTTRMYGGTGLGLTITKQLVELMGGSIGIESKAGEGTRVSLNIPFRLPDIENSTADEHLTSVDSSDQAVMAKGMNGHHRVLVVEDNQLNQYLMSNMLDKLGIEYDIAADGIQAMEYYENNRDDYDLVLMDCHMPRMDGFEATRHIRRIQGNKQNIPIIAITALAMVGDEEKCYQAGMSDYITKPVSMRQLNDILNAWFVKGAKTASQV